MSRSEGQERALEQLRDIEAVAEGSVSVEEVLEPAEAGDKLRVIVSLACADLEHAAGGLPLDSRERFVVLIPANFPFRIPDVHVMHDRFAGFPHVQWKQWLCLYQAPATEWNSGDGMFGFIERLHFWLKQGALDQLDPVGAALHPPVTYTPLGPERIVIPRVDAPVVADRAWFGAAHLRVVSDLRVDLIGWSPLASEIAPADVAAAVLLPTAFPPEFPRSVADLIQALEDRGVSREWLFLTLQWAILRNPEEAPLYVIIGAAMRGTRGGELRQHLTAWYLDPVLARGLRLAIQKYSADAAARELGEKIEGIVLDWARTASVRWCDVQEDRPEIVTRRDHRAPLRWFLGRRVAIWGCGALGGHTAEYLARAGVKKLFLHDNGVVKPGILVRQPFDDADVGRNKVDALRDRLARIRPELEIETSAEDVLSDPLGLPDWASDVGLIIDATASVSVLELLERRRRNGVSAAPVTSMVIGHLADRGMVVLSRPEHSGGPLDVFRQLKLAACADPASVEFLNEFWPHERRSFFQPEPGCSDATFIGSAADVAALAAVLLSRIAADLDEPPVSTTSSGHFVALPGFTGGQAAHHRSYHWTPDHITDDPQAGYQIRIAPAAWKEARTWILHSRDAVGPEVETGGLLFGERDDAAGVMWVSEFSGPPPDSDCSDQHFVCGIEGTAELNRGKRNRSRGSIQYLGMWHTHPDDVPLPSPTDWDGMRRLVRAAGGGGRYLMLIIGHPFGAAMLGGYVFRARDFELAHGSVVIRSCAVKAMSWN